jgi:hypothetical protein
MTDKLKSEADIVERIRNARVGNPEHYAGMWWVLAGDALDEIVYLRKDVARLREALNNRASLAAYLEGEETR